MAINYEILVKEWMAGATTAAIAKACGTTPAGLSVAACVLRKKGVNLPRRRRGIPSRLDVAALNAIIEAAHE